MSDESPFFKGYEKIPFKTSTTGYDRHVAWWLAQCSCLSYATKNIVAQELKKVGFNKVVFFDTRGTQAFLAQHPGHGEGQFAILAFRGTEQDSVDILTDINIFRRLFPDENLVAESSSTGQKPVKLYVHGGFLEGVLNVWGTQLRPEVETIFPDAEDSYWVGFPGISNEICKLEDTPLYFTGHSLGGALATLATYKSLVYGDWVNFAGLYTFGSPRTVQKDLAKRISNDPKLINKLHRVVNFDDVVPRVPPRLPPLFQFRHISELVYFGADRKRIVISSKFLLFLMDLKVIALTIAEIILWALTFTNYTPRTIKCHMISKYIADLENDL